MTPVPAVPPITDSFANAQVKMALKAPGTAARLITSTTTEPPRKVSAIIGTTISATFEILLIPPIVTTAVSTVMMTPATMIGIWNVTLTDSVIAFTCGNVPQPNNAVHMPNTEKAFASQINLSPIPFWI